MDIYTKWEVITDAFRLSFNSFWIKEYMKKTGWSILLLMNMKYIYIQDMK